ncbi:MAG: hypothetical protein ABI548_24865 [Polyangiaceae bacterium]
MQTFQSSTWADVDALRTGIMAGTSASIEDAAKLFVDQLATYSTVVLARVFLVLPLSGLPETEQAAARGAASGASQLNSKTPVLALLGSAGRLPQWRERTKSVGHLAIPLLSSDHVQNIPMIAKLLSDLEVNLAGLDDGKPIATRRMLGGLNAAFFVADAASSLDGAGRHIIPAQDFVAANEVRTVFGMGGAYADGTLAVAIVFTSETIDRAVVDRFPSVISNFKMATATLLSTGRVYRGTP